MMADLMENQNCESPKVDEIPDLGMVLGQNQTFGLSRRPLFGGAGREHPAPAE
jgi:hypothetical protein